MVRRAAADLNDGDRAAIERLAAEHFAGPVRLGTAEVLTERRSVVRRVPLALRPADVPASVIVKQARRDGERGYDPDDPDPEGPAALLFNEWAGYRIIEMISAARSMAPRVLGGDRERGLLILEDLGTGPSLADVLLGDDAGEAERALLAYAEALGRLGGATAGRKDEYLAIRRTLGPSDGQALPRDLAKAFEVVRGLAGAVAVEVPDGAEEEVRAVIDVLAQPGPFLAYSPSDDCPDNNRWVDGRLRLFDFEGGGFRHALLDGAYLILALPSCWCVNRVPKALGRRVLDRYRRELSVGCPDAADDDRFRPAMAAACAAWLLWSTSWMMPRALDADVPMPPTTFRQCIRLRFERFPAIAEDAGCLAALAELSRRFAARLRRRWRDTPAMPLYPAFRRRHDSRATAASGEARHSASKGSASS